MSIIREQVDGRAFEVVELTDGFVVILKEPGGNTVRKAALTVEQVRDVLKGFGLDLLVSNDVH